MSSSLAADLEPLVQLQCTFEGQIGWIQADTVEVQLRLSEADTSNRMSVAEAGSQAPVAQGSGAFHMVTFVVMTYGSGETL